MLQMIFCSVLMALVVVVAGVDEVKHIQQFSIYAVFVNVGPNEEFEVCEGETFKPQCPPNELVVISKAVYGRMATKRCLDARASQQLGCADDVVNLLDHKCSGKETCEVKVQSRQDDFANLRQCPFDLLKYLLVEYNCVKVLQSTGSCQLPMIVPIGKETPSISQNLATRDGCEVVNLQANPGEIMKLSIMEFSDSSNTLLSSCFGEILDIHNNKKMTLCSKSGRLRDLYTTTGHEARLVMDRAKIDKLGLKFLINAKSEGCADIQPPKGAWISRVGSALNIGCNHNQNSWYLECKNSRWIGIIGNCSYAVAMRVEEPVEEVLSPNGLSKRGINFRC